MEKLQTTELYLEKNNFWEFKSKYEFVDGWFLMSSPYPLLALTLAYILFILKLGPAYLKNRKPYELKTVIVLYNAAQIVISGAMLYLTLQLVKKVGLFQRTCSTDTDGRVESITLELTSAAHYYFLCKLTELLDTIFFVLRKKYNQVTFLHVYHHTMMVWNSWFFLKYEPGYWMLCLGVLNSFVHVVMYAYYGLSAFPSLHKYLWWKKYITSLQLIQFFLLIVQLTISLFISECKPSKMTVIYFYFSAFFFIYLFSNFYTNAYSKSKKVDDIITTEHKNELNGSTTKNKSNIEKKYSKASHGIKNGNLLKNGTSISRRRV